MPGRGRRHQPVEGGSRKYAISSAAEYTQRLAALARRIREQLAQLWWCQRHPDTPWYARALIVLVVAYAASPIDLIPDFIPVLGLVDDAIIVPLGVALALRLVPPHVRAQARARHDLAGAPQLRGRWAVSLAIALAWVAAAALVARWAWPYLRARGLA